MKVQNVPVCVRAARLVQRCLALPAVLQVPAPTVGAPDHHVADVCIRRRVGAAAPLEVRPAGQAAARWFCHVHLPACTHAVSSHLMAAGGAGLPFLCPVFLFAGARGHHRQCGQRQEHHGEFQSLQHLMCCACMVAVASCCVVVWRHAFPLVPCTAHQHSVPCKAHAACHPAPVPCVDSPLARWACSPAPSWMMAAALHGPRCSSTATSRTRVGGQAAGVQGAGWLTLLAALPAACTHQGRKQFLRCPPCCLPNNACPLRDSSHLQAGRTSSIGQHTLCLDSKGDILNDPAFRTQSIADYVKQASKVLSWGRGGKRASYCPSAAATPSPAGTTLGLHHQRGQSDASKQLSCDLWCCCAPACRRW